MTEPRERANQRHLWGLLEGVGAAHPKRKALSPMSEERPMKSEFQKDVMAGQAVYSKAMLATYDLFVLGLSNRFMWKCPTPRLLAHYNAHVSSSHLDLGVGTGFFLDRCAFPNNPRIVLVDLNPNCLEATARRISRYQPKTYRRNVLEPLELDEERFDSIGMNYLLHCVPGNIRTKAVVFDHIDRYLNPRGVVFGSTLLQGGVLRSAGAKRLMNFYNSKGIFSNVEDDLADLQAQLTKRFGESKVDVVGCAALYWARK